MNVNALIKAALDPFGDPVEYGAYVGAAETYYVFNGSTLGSDYGDDEPGHERHLVQVHFFCPLKVDALIRQKRTKQALFAAGFTWPSMIDATDTESRHYVFECEYVAGVDVDGDDEES